jgi:Fe-S-cluster-containing dehydrogenase component
MSKKILLIDFEKCIGCRRCELICSYNKEGLFSETKSRIHVFSWPDTGECIPKTAKCDLCMGDPMCVKWCPRGVLRFVHVSKNAVATNRSASERLNKLLAES